MKKVLKIIVLLLFVGFIAIQFIPAGMSNPAVNQSETLEASTEVPDNVKAILKTSCNDCHSNNTVYPWYSNVAPASWFLADHIREGREEMNFSVWNTYEAKKKDKKLEEICSEIQDKEMPLPSYLWIHWDAKLSDEQIKIVCDWVEGERNKLEKSGSEN